MHNLEKLNAQEKELIYKAPVYVSLLAANADGKMDEKEKQVASEFAHVKTYSSPLILRDFYKEVKIHFMANIEEVNAMLPTDKEEREKELKKKLTELNPLFVKLGREYATALHKGLNNFKDHVSKAHRNSLTSFILPVYIKGITDL
jgi:hypothetical protein